MQNIWVADKSDLMTQPDTGISHGAQFCSGVASPAGGESMGKASGKDLVQDCIFTKCSCNGSENSGPLHTVPIAPGCVSGFHRISACDTAFSDFQFSYRTIESADQDPSRSFSGDRVAGLPFSPQRVSALAWGLLQFWALHFLFDRPQPNHNMEHAASFGPSRSSLLSIAVQHFDRIELPNIHAGLLNGPLGGAVELSSDATHQTVECHNSTAGLLRVFEVNSHLDGGGVPKGDPSFIARPDRPPCNDRRSVVDMETRGTQGADLPSREGHPMSPKVSEVRRYVAYLRVSTDRQGQSGLGLDAQQSAITAYLGTASKLLLPPFIEVESGRKAARPKLAEAIEKCRRTGATLLVAKLDRLSRNADFLRALIASDVDVAFCDLPHVPPGAMGKFLLSQMALVAELEAGLTSERTKAALAMAKARGVVLGGDRGYRPTTPPDWQAGAAASVAARVRTADHHAHRAMEAVRAIQESQGAAVSLRALADALTAQGIPTPRGGAAWTATAARCSKFSFYSFAHGVGVARSGVAEVGTMGGARALQKRAREECVAQLHEAWAAGVWPYRSLRVTRLTMDSIRLMTVDDAQQLETVNMSNIIPFPKATRTEQPRFTSQQRDELLALAGVVAGGHEGRVVLGEFEIDAENDEAFYLVPGGGADASATVFFHEDALSVLIEPDDIHGPFADIAAVSAALLRLLGRRRPTRTTTPTTTEWSLTPSYNAATRPVVGFEWWVPHTTKAARACPEPTLDTQGWSEAEGP
eukprot:gene5770-5833_t